jgi:hypothetical protein
VAHYLAVLEQANLTGLLEFCRRYPKFQPLVLCSPERAEETIAGMRLMSWRDFLLGKPLAAESK